MRGGREGKEREGEKERNLNFDDATLTPLDVF